ncbi:MAG: LTA synthase family protein, partial [Ruthenibacterium sp.]
MHTLLKHTHAAGCTRVAHIVFAGVVPTVCLLTMELLHRGTLWKDFFDGPFWNNFPSYGLTWLLLLAVYVLLCAVTRMPWLATLIVGLVTNAAGLICYYKLQMRGEPFLPWDFSQIGDLIGVADKVSFQVKPFMFLALGAFLLLLLCSCFLRLPKDGTGSKKVRLVAATASILCGVALIFGVFLQPAVSRWFGIYQDMWMQDRYYRNYGVITGFLTNLDVLNITEPEGYSQEKIKELEKRITQQSADQKPLYDQSYAATTENPEKKPNIIFVMNESFWDVSRLKGVEYDRPVTPNLTELRNEAASGYVFSPSFGGGTCDVEFEALTGFSIEHLPAGCKPFQQHVTKAMFSLPQYLKTNGYETLAIHGYFAKFWSRNIAYPNLGIDTFLAAEDFKNPDKKRGFISDAAMTDRIIEEYEARTDDAPLFIHAVTMQNHTTYDEKRYPKNELIGITKTPAGLSGETISQLRDFATGVYEADAALGTLVDYFRGVDEPTI